MPTFDNFITSLRNEFGEQEAGKKFEVFCKWFLENEPEWSKTIDKVWLWDDYPNKWQRQDLGTDLIFRDKEGLIWAVQAKCYSEHRATTKGDMNSFLADTGRKEVDKRLWLQTTNKMEAKADKTLKGQDKPVTVFNLNDFRDAQIDYPTSYAGLFQAKVKDKPTPDPHQIEAIQAVQSKLQTLDRGQMIMACGTGKTFTTLWIKEALKAHTTLVLLPSLSLLSQTMREWAWAGNTDFEILNVCSDKSVGKKTEDMEVSDAPFPVTSEPAEIAKFLRRPEPKVIFCTYQSSPLIAEVQLDVSVPAFDLTIADEAHRCAGKADAGFATILDANKIRSNKRLFTTATPRYFGNTVKDAANAKDLTVVGMDDVKIFGPIIHQLTFGEAIQRNLLTDYQMVIVGVDQPMVKQWIDEYEIVATNPDETTDARTLAAKIGLIKAIKDYDLKRVISFHRRVDGARKFSEELVNVVDLIDPIHRPEGTFLADYVSGVMKAGDRKEKIDRLKVLDNHDRGILTNARCLAEGVDVPSLDGVAFIDPRGSQVEIIQAVGRAIRKVRGVAVQRKGTIVIPVFIEDGDDPETSIEESNFKPVWDVLKALRAHDEILADVLDQYRTDMAKNNGQNQRNITDKVIFDIPSSVDVEFSNALRTVIVEASTASWEFWYGLLEEFKERVGHCNVPATLKEGDFNLGGWVSNQRKNKETLTPERLERLNALGFAWNILTEQWEEGFSKLLQFKERKGNCRVPKGHKEGDFNLVGWVGRQRANKETLTPERLERLNALGFVWDVLAERWEEGFSKLQQFKEREGHCRVPKGHKEGDFNLGTWVGTQRANKDTLTPERLERLNALGFVWKGR
jgi:predicted helicase